MHSGIWNKHNTDCSVSMGNGTGWPWLSHRELYSWIYLCFILANSAVPHVYLFISHHQSYASSFPFHTAFFNINTVTLIAYTSQQVWGDKYVINGFQCKYCDCLVQRWAWMWCFQESVRHFWKRNMTVSVYGSVQTKNPWRNQEPSFYCSCSSEHCVQHSAAA